jgi:enediyne biosynthesis protein E4
MRTLFILLVVLVVGCSSDNSPGTLFTDITSQSGLNFHNSLTFTERLNPYTYRNFFNGAGVAIGDINNDGLLDIYLAGNQVENKLYLNKGNLTFEDITGKAGVACKGAWSTGVTFADINGDGLVDLYVCKSGDPESHNRNNELFINNGDLTFTERSKEYGLDIVGLSVQAAFFDFDKDGDLDCYLLTNSFKAVGNYDLVKNQREIADPLGGGNKFFINENGVFSDRTKEAAIYRSNIGFGLGITLGDFNDDSWVDIFVSNDFFERDYLYINNQHGGFSERLTEYFQSISMGSMGADFADLDNDGVSELFVTEMLPDSLSRRKTKTVFENWNKYQLNLENEYYHQFSRNVLQKKISSNQYVEIGRFAGVAASEWSWGALLFDMDNDGFKDIFIANGIVKDLLDRDYLTYHAASENVRNIIKKEKEKAILKLIDLMPSSRFPDYAFKNSGNFHFTNKAREWGLDNPTFSNGSAYGDFDNDGDLDLIVNNLNSASILYRNNSDSLRFKNITVRLKTKSKNTLAVGAEITAFCGTRMFSGNNFVTRGFQSSVQPYVTIGLGEHSEQIDSLLIKWPDHGYSVLYDIPVNRSVLIVKENTEVRENWPGRKAEEKKIELELMTNTLFRHRSSGLVDFNRDRLLPMMYSNETPSLLKADIDGDGMDEVYIGGGKDQSGAFIDFAKEKVATFLPKAIAAFKLSEETRSTFVDVDNDGDVDLYMACGGRFFPKSSSALTDMIFINDGKGDFTPRPEALPSMLISTSVVKPFDFDNDGDQDLIIGERFDPFTYGKGGRGYILRNDGRGIFSDVTNKSAPDLLKIGMVTDIEIQDMDADGQKEIILAGDWMPIVVLKNKDGVYKNASDDFGLQHTTGWWHDIEAADFNGDGKSDFVFGNHGLNTFFKPADRMYVNDFDDNGSTEQIFCTRVGDKYYPVTDRDELISQLPSLKRQVLFYSDYRHKSIDELFPGKVIENAKVYQVDLLSSILLLSDSAGYKRIALPEEAQYSPMYGLLAVDFDNDGVEDLIAGGNQYEVKPQFGRYDASAGWFFRGTLQISNSHSHRARAWRSADRSEISSMLKSTTLRVFYLQNMMMIWKSIRYGLSLLACSVLFYGCQSDYTKLVKEELAKGVRKDSVLLGIKLGDSRYDFYGRCYDLNKKQLIIDGGGGFVQYLFTDSLVHQKPEPMKLLFHPNFDKKNNLAEMFMEFSYVGWSPAVARYQSDSLKEKVMDMLVKWYGGNEFVQAKVDSVELPVKVDGNRRIVIYHKDAQAILVKVQDLLHPIFMHSFTREEQKLKNK